LGATLFRLLIGRPPLAASPNLSPLSKLKLLASHDAPRADTLRSDVPKGLANFIATLLAREPDRRPGSAAHLAEQLSQFATGNDLVKLADQAAGLQKTASLEESSTKLPKPTRVVRWQTRMLDAGVIGGRGWPQRLDFHRCCWRRSCC
jgi:serine/threonine protein kinase